MDMEYTRLAKALPILRIIIDRFPLTSEFMLWHPWVDSYIVVLIKLKLLSRITNSFTVQLLIWIYSFSSVPPIKKR